MDTPINHVDTIAYDKATVQGHKLMMRSPLAISARYAAGRVYVELNNGCAFVFPVAHAQVLANASARDLRTIKIQAAGLGLYWPSLDADLYVPSLVKGVLGTKQWMAKIGAAGGAAKTKAKSMAARTNGKLGGRPRKTLATHTTSPAPQDHAST